MNVARAFRLLNLPFASPLAPATIPGNPGTLSRQNAPAWWPFDSDNRLPTTSVAPKTDWFVDPFDGSLVNTAPILLFQPDSG
jgi:hypothetical protein